MTAPLAPAVTGSGAPQVDEAEAVRQEVRARFAESQRAKLVRQVAREEERKLRQARRAKKTAERRMARLHRADDIADGAGGWVRRAAPVAAAAVPVAMVNATAFVGQFAYIKDHVPWILPGQVLVAATFESVAVYLAFHAHLAMMKNDSSTRLKLGAQLFALVMAGMNYSHNSVHWRPTVLAVGLGLMSLLSPSLWGIYSRRAARDKLMERGLVEEHAVRLGANRWTWHPVRSVQVMWRATWLGENDPKRAIALHEAAQESHRAIRSAHRQARQAVRASRATGSGAPLARLARHGAPEIPAPLAQQAAPAGGAPVQLPAAPLARTEGETARQVLPGTQLNGHPVETRAIANLTAEPAMRSSHEIDPQRIADAELYLAGLSADSLPSERFLVKMLCDKNHDHRRQARPLLEARRAAGNDPLPAFAQRHRPANAPTVIASPVANLPGGKQANG